MVVEVPAFFRLDCGRTGKEVVELPVRISWRRCSSWQAAGICIAIGDPCHRTIKMRIVRGGQERPGIEEPAAARRRVTLVGIGGSNAGFAGRESLRISSRRQGEPVSEPAVTILDALGGSARGIFDSP